MLSFAKSVINHLPGEAINVSVMTIVVIAVIIKNTHPVITAFEIPIGSYARIETY